MSLENIRQLFTQEPDVDSVPTRPLTESEINYFRAVEAQDAQFAAHAAAKAAAEAEYQDSFDGRTEQYRAGEPPSAKELGVKVSGLLPAQERLVRYVAWRDQAVAEVQRLKAARDQFFTVMGAPVVAQAEIDKLTEQDRSGFLGWVRAGATKATQYTVDSFRRAKLETKLSEATYEAEIARAGLAGIDADIEFAEAVVQILEKRHSAFVYATIREATLGHVAEYGETVCRLQTLAAKLAGADKVSNGGRFVGSRNAIDVRLPPFGNATAHLVVDRHEIDHASGPWRDLERRLLTDPRADLSVKSA